MTCSYRTKYLPNTLRIEKNLAYLKSLTFNASDIIKINIIIFHFTKLMTSHHNLMIYTPLSNGSMKVVPLQAVKKFNFYPKTLCKLANTLSTQTKWNSTSNAFPPECPILFNYKLNLGWAYKSVPPYVIITYCSNVSIRTRIYTTEKPESCLGVCDWVECAF